MNHDQGSLRVGRIIGMPSRKHSDFGLEIAKPLGLRTRNSLPASEEDTPTPTLNRKTTHRDPHVYIYIIMTLLYGVSVDNGLAPNQAHEMLLGFLILSIKCVRFSGWSMKTC